MKNSQKSFMFIDALIVLGIILIIEIAIIPKFEKAASIKKQNIEHQLKPINIK